MIETHITPISLEDRKPVIDIFNYYIENSFAAYIEKSVSYGFFDFLLKASDGFPAIVIKNGEGGVIGFGMLRPFHPFPVFSKTAEISYFISPDWVGKGLGNKMLAHLIKKAEEKGITSILASISSLNQPSIRFHQKNGFLECGRFEKVGEKKGQVFDVVYMQKIL